jgi:hypothetical protein
MDIYGVGEAVCQAVRDNVNTSAILSRKMTVTTYMPDGITEPHFFAAEYDIDFDKSMRGLTVVEFTFRVMVGKADDKTSQRLCAAMFAPTGDASLKAAIEATRDHATGALNGLVDDLHVTRMTGLRWYEHNGTQYVGGELTVKVMGE